MGKVWIREKCVWQKATGTVIAGAQTGEEAYGRQQAVQADIMAWRCHGRALCFLLLPSSLACRTRITLVFSWSQYGWCPSRHLCSTKKVAMGHPEKGLKEGKSDKSGHYSKIRKRLIPPHPRGSHSFVEWMARIWSLDHLQLHMHPSRWLVLAGYIVI